MTFSYAKMRMKHSRMGPWTLVKRYSRDRQIRPRFFDCVVRTEMSLTQLDRAAEFFAFLSGCGESIEAAQGPRDRLLIDWSNRFQVQSHALPRFMPVLSLVGHGAAQDGAELAFVAQQSIGDVRCQRQRFQNLFQWTVKYRVQYRKQAQEEEPVRPIHLQSFGELFAHPRSRRASDNDVARFVFKAGEQNQTGPDAHPLQAHEYDRVAHRFDFVIKTANSRVDIS